MMTASKLWSLENELVQIFQTHPTVLTQTLNSLRYADPERLQALFPVRQDRDRFLDLLQTVESRVMLNSPSTTPESSPSMPNAPTSAGKL